MQNRLNKASSYSIFKPVFDVLNAFRKFLIKNPAIAITIIWIICMIALRLFVVTAMHQPGGKEYNPEIRTNLPGAVKADGVYYLRIVENGYDLTSSNPAFYPGFPLAVNIISRIGVGKVLAGQAINTIALIVAAQGLYVLALIVANKRRIALFTVLAWLAFPSSHFFIAFYSESLFVAFSVWALVFALKQKYVPAVVLASLASFTRATGVILGIVIALQYLADRKWKLRELDWRVLLLPISFVCIGAYWLWIYDKTSILPWQFFSEMYQKFWPYMRFQPNIFFTLWSELKVLWKLPFSTQWQDLWVNELFTKLHFFLAWLAIVWSAWLSWKKKFPIALVTYSGLTALMLILTGNFVSHSRYLLPVFPFFILTAMWLERRSEAVRTLYFVITAAGLGIMLAMFANGYWVG